MVGCVGVVGGVMMEFLMVCGIRVADLVVGIVLVIRCVGMVRSGVVGDLVIRGVGDLVVRGVWVSDCVVRSYSVVRGIGMVNNMVGVDFMVRGVWSADSVVGRDLVVRGRWVVDKKY